MMLSTLRQTYQEFKNRYQAKKISMSYFVKCRPKNCVFLGSSGTHMICVCTIHQNVKQMLFSMFSPLNLKVEIDVHPFEFQVRKSASIRMVI